MSPRSPRSPAGVPASDVKPSSLVLLNGDFLGKRHQRSNSSAEASSSYNDELVDADHHNVKDQSSSSPYRVFASPSVHSGHSTTPNEASGSSRDQQLGEDTLTLRRREANRLAAQRFRSRKKGYQDSLEEKVRQLEEDKELLMRKITEMGGPGLRSTLGISNDDESRPWLSDHPRIPDGNRPYPPSPERRDAVDVDIRIASLESANRSLQDELRNVSEENDRLRDEVEQWRRWERDQRELRSISTSRRDDRRPLPQRHPSLPSFERSLSHATNLTPNSSTPQGFSVTPFASMSHSPAHMKPPPISPVDGVVRPPSPGLRLPPIRLAPLHVTSADALSPSSRSHFLPRPAELDHAPSSMSPSLSTRKEDRGAGDDRRR